MKKQVIFWILFLVSLPASFAQQSACRNDTLRLQTASYRGEHFWQQSQNGADWTRMSNAGAAQLELIAEESMFYRYEVLDGTCNPYYSEVIEVLVNPIPSVELSNIDSVCVNNSAFVLSSGIPAGGHYSGAGIVDGKFIASMAGAGIHSYFYYYQDPETKCANTAGAAIQVIPAPTVAQAGSDNPEIVADSIRMDANAPLEGEGYWTISSGNGGSFSNPTDPKAWFRKGPGLDYILTWTIENKCGSSSDQISLTFLKLSSNPCPGTPVVFDADGNRYTTVQIGEQCWMGENLKVGVTVTSTETNRAHSDAADNGIIEKYALFNDEANVDLYGGLYDWDEMMGYTMEEGAQGICPEGWHVPSLAEWDELDHFYKTRDSGGHLKVGGDSGFEGILAGDRHSYGFFVSFESSGFFWASSTYSYNGANDGWIRELCACTNTLDRIHFSKKTGASVRCLKNK